MTLRETIIDDMTFSVSQTLSALQSMNPVLYENGRFLESEPFSIRAFHTNFAQLFDIVSHFMQAGVRARDKLACPGCVCAYVQQCLRCSVEME